MTDLKPASLIDASARSSPRGVRAVNLAGRALRRVGWTPDLDPNELIASARRHTQLDDLGDEHFLEPLSVYLRSLDGEARLTPFGRLVARSNVITLLNNRLRMQDWWNRHPEILEVPVSRPWFVVGLPRSGTTLIQNLLAMDASNRSLRFWEAAEPAPPPEATRITEDPRIQRARRAHRMLNYLAPEAQDLHPVTAQSPTECVSLLAHSFASLEFGAVHQVDSHVRWCLQADLEPHYTYLRQQLQLLQWHDGRDRWVLKSPAHLVGFEALMRVFPDARIVWMHRDPIAAVTSHCSLTTVLNSIGSDEVDRRAIGARWSEVWVRGVQRAMAVRSAQGDAAICDIPYENLVDDPLGTVAKVYAWDGASLGEQALQAMRSHLKDQRRSGHTHRYRPEDFGLTSEDLHDRFWAYLERFPGLRTR